MLHLILTLSEIPDGTKYRVIGADLPYWNGKTLIETEIDLGLEKAPAKFPNGVPTDAKNCIAEWKEKAKDVEPVEAEAKELIDKLDALAIREPVKTMAAMEKSTAIASVKAVEEKPIEEKP